MVSLGKCLPRKLKRSNLRTGSTLYLASWWNCLKQKTMIEIPLVWQVVHSVLFLFWWKQNFSSWKQCIKKTEGCTKLFSELQPLYSCYFDPTSKSLFSRPVTLKQKNISEHHWHFYICISRFNAWLNRNLLDVCTGMSMVLSHWTKTYIYVSRLISSLGPRWNEPTHLLTSYDHFQQDTLVL